MANYKRSLDPLIVGQDSQDPQESTSDRHSKTRYSFLDVSGVALLATFIVSAVIFGGRGLIAGHSIKLILYLSVIISCVRILINKVKSDNDENESSDSEPQTLRKTRIFSYFLPVLLYLIFQNISFPLDFLGHFSEPAKIAYEKSGSLWGSISIDRSESINALSWVFLFVALYCLGLGVRFEKFSIKQKIRSSKSNPSTVFFSKESREYDSYSELIQKVVIGVSMFCAIIGITHLMMRMQALFGIFSFTDNYQFTGRANWPFVNANQLAVMVEMGTMLCFTRFLRERQLRSLSLSAKSHVGIVKSIEQVFYSLEKQATTLLMIFVQVICLILTLSRAGIGLTFLGMTILWFIYKLNPVVMISQRSESSRRRNQTPDSKFKKTRSLLKISIFPLILFFFFFSFLGDDVSSKLSSRVDQATAQNGDTSRWALNEISLSIFELNPLFGIGLNNWQDAADQFSFDETIGWKLDYAHNDYLQFLSEVGLVGLLFALIPVIPGVKNLLTLRETHLGPVRKVFISGLFLSFLVPAAHAFVDFPYHLPILSFGILLLFLTLSRSIIFLLSKTTDSFER